MTLIDLIPIDQVPNILNALENAGFQYIEYDELDESYDGIMEDKNTFSSWWIRYFDWI
jgi:hypothetical protein